MIKLFDALILAATCALSLSTTVAALPMNPNNPHNSASHWTDTFLNFEHPIDTHHQDINAASSSSNVENYLGDPSWDHSMNTFWDSTASNEHQTAGPSETYAHEHGIHFSLDSHQPLPFDQNQSFAPNQFIDYSHSPGVYYPELSYDEHLPVQNPLQPFDFHDTVIPHHLQPTPPAQIPSHRADRLGEYDWQMQLLPSQVLQVYQIVAFHWSPSLKEAQKLAFERLNAFLEQKPELVPLILHHDQKSIDKAARFSTPRPTSKGIEHSWPWNKFFDWIESPVRVSQSFKNFQYRWAPPGITPPEQLTFIEILHRAWMKARDDVKSLLARLGPEEVDPWIHNILFNEKSESYAFALEWEELLKKKWRTNLSKSKLEKHEQSIIAQTSASKKGRQGGRGSFHHDQDQDHPR